MLQKSLRLELKSIGAVVGLLFCSTVVAAGPIPVVGDQEPLRALREAFDPASRRFEKGRMVAHVEVDSAPDKERVKADVEMIWDGSKTYWKFSADYTNRETGKISQASRRNSVLIETPSGTISYMPDAELLVVAPPKRQSVPYELQLRPDHTVTRGGFSYRGRPWHDVLDPEFQKDQDLISRLAIETLADARLKLTRSYFPELTFREEGKVLGVIRNMPDTIIEGNLALGVVTSFSTDPYIGIGGEVVSGERSAVEWVPDAKGRPCVRSFRRRSFTTDQSNPEWRFEVTVSEYEHEPRIARNLFDRSSIPMKEGLNIREISNIVGQPSRETQIGKKATGLTTESLDTLGREGRKGFAGPSRK